jgi:hypothetical protein
MNVALALIALFMAPQDDSRIEAFSRELAGEDELTLRFRDMAESSTGQVVIRDRIGKEEQRLRREGQRNLPGKYIQTYFVEREGKYHLKPGREAFGKNLAEEEAAYRSDLERIRPGIARVAGRLEGSGKLHEELIRFLTHEFGPDHLYTVSVLPRLRPGRREFERVYGRLLVRGPGGEYSVPEGRISQARQQLRQSRTKSEALKSVREDLRRLSREIAGVDELHLRLKEASMDRLFAGILVENKLKNRNPQVMVKAAEGFYGEMLKSFRETGDGLVLRDGPRKKIVRIFQKYDRIKKLLPSLRIAARDFIARVRSGDEVHDTIRELLSTEISLMFVADRLRNLSTDVAEALQAMWRSILEETPGGGLRIKKGAERQVQRVVRTAFRRFRGDAGSRKKFDRFAGQVSDGELGAVHRSFTGRYAVNQVMARLFEKMEFDGFAAWKKRCFRVTEAGLEIRDDARADLEKMIAERAAIEKEGEKDDF